MDVPVEEPFTNHEKRMMLLFTTSDVPKDALLVRSFCCA